MPCQPAQELWEPLQSPEGICLSWGSRMDLSPQQAQKQGGQAVVVAGQACPRQHIPTCAGRQPGQGLQLQAAKSLVLALHQGWPMTTPACSVLRTP